MFANLPIDWTRFAIGAGVLLFPLPLLFGRGVAYRELDRAWSRYTSQALTLPWHYIDAIRAAIGARLLLTSLIFSPMTQAGRLSKEVIVVFAAVFALSVIVQTVVCKAPHSFNAACVFVFAVTAAFYPPMLAGLTLISAVTVSLAMRSLPAFFFVVPICLVGLGLLLLPKWTLLAVWPPAAILPALLPVLFQRDLVLAHRAVPVEREPDLR